MGETSTMAKKTKQDLEWEANADVDTLIRTQQILDDSGRRKRALIEIKKRRGDVAQAEAQLMRRTSERAKKYLGGE